MSRAALLLIAERYRAEAVIYQERGQSGWAAKCRREAKRHENLANRGITRAH